MSECVRSAPRSTLPWTVPPDAASSGSRRRRRDEYRGTGIASLLREGVNVLAPDHGHTRDADAGMVGSAVLGPDVPEWGEAP